MAPGQILITSALPTAESLENHILNTVSEASVIRRKLRRKRASVVASIRNSAAPLKRTGDPNLGNFGDSTVPRTFGIVPRCGRSICRAANVPPHNRAISAHTDMMYRARCHSRSGPNRPRRWRVEAIHRGEATCHTCIKSRAEALANLPDQARWSPARGCGHLRQRNGRANVFSSRRPSPLECWPSAAATQNPA
jgi:hypothetical protein